jgi:hypothetical protein
MIGAQHRQIVRRKMRNHFISEFFVDPRWRAPAQRPNRAAMSRVAFVGLVAGWIGFLSGMLFILIFIRLLGWGD